MRVAGNSEGGSVAVKKRRIAGPGRLGSIANAKKSVKRKGGDSRIRTIAAEDSVTARFLQEPEDWHGFYEHWINDAYVPCTEGDCDGCDAGIRKTFRYLANAYIVDDSKVCALKMPKTVVEQLLARYEKHGTVMDRDYELSRTGSGQTDTVYMVTPEPPQKMKLSRFDKDLIDLEEVLESLLDDEAVDDDEDDKPKKKKTRNPWADDDDDDEGDEDDEDDEEDDDEEDDEPVRKVKKSAKKKVAPKKTVKKSVKKSATKRR